MEERFSNNNSTEGEDMFPKTSNATQLCSTPSKGRRVVQYLKRLGSARRALNFLVAVITLAVAAGQPAHAQYIDYNDVQFHATLVGNCIDANTGQFGVPTYMRPCDDKNNPNLRWDVVRVPNGFQLRTRTTGNCLDANSGTFGAVTYMRPCDDGSNQNLLWHFQYVGSGFQIKTRTTELCLDANTGQFGQVTYMRPCDNGENPNLHWGMQK